MNHINLKDKAKRLKEDVPAVYIALTDRQTPLYAKAAAGLTVAYALSPIDLIPDFIPILGYVDDILILPLLVWLTVRLIPEQVWKKSKEKASGIWRNGKPKRWYFAIPIVLFWLVVVGSIITSFCSQ